MRDALRHHRAHRDATPTRGERAAERFAEFLGTTRFLVISSLIILLWVLVNATGFLFRWDPYPFILLNLAFSAFAFYTGALVIIAQKAQTARDRAGEAADAKHRQELHDQLVQLIDANTKLTADVHALVVGESDGNARPVSADE